MRVFIQSALICLLSLGPVRSQTTSLPLQTQQKLVEINSAWHVGGGSANPDNVAADLKLFTPLLKAADKSGVDILRGQPFGSDPAQVLDVYRPVANAPSMVRAPIVIYFHGGAYVRGDKDLTDEIFGNVAIWFARHGVLAFNANYRLAPGASWPSGADDVAMAVAWAKLNAARFGGDPSRVFLVGNSAGATHIASYAFDRDRQPRADLDVSGVVLISGRYLLNDKSDSPVRANLQAYFGTDPSLYTARSPITHIADAKMPVFIAFAEFEDPELDVVGAQLFAALCLRDGSCPRIHRIVGHNHLSTVFAFNTSDDAFGREILDFMKERR